MSTQSSESGSDTSLDCHEPLTTNSHITGSKRKLVIDTRRAEQNRAAQRAFRQRKELYLKELENKVRDMDILKDRVERLEIENKRLKYRVWELESPPNSTTSSTNSTTAPLTPAPTNSNNISPTSASSYHHIRHSSHGDDEIESVRYSPQNQYDRKNNNTVRANETKEATSPPQALTSTTNVSHHILPPPSPSPTVFRPIPVAYWDKDTNKMTSQQQQQQQQQYQHYHHIKLEDSTTHSEQGRVLDDLASILRTRHRPPIRQQHQPIKPEPMHI